MPKDTGKVRCITCGVDSVASSQVVVHKDSCKKSVLIPVVEPKDNCQLCHGKKGGVAGNENIVDDIIMCDYCHVEYMESEERVRNKTETFCCSSCGLIHGNPCPICNREPVDMPKDYSIGCAAKEEADASSAD